MLIEILTLFAGAGLEQVTSVTWHWVSKWAAKKADEKNQVIQTALVTSYCKALQVIRKESQQLPQWKQDKAEIEARLTEMEKDALMILDLVQTQKQRITHIPQGGEEQAIARVVMSKLQSKDKWLKHAPMELCRLVETRLVSVTVYQFRHELRTESTVFQALIHDMLATAGEDVSRLVDVTHRIEKRVDQFVGEYRKDIDIIVAGISGANTHLEQLVLLLNKKMKQSQAIPADFAALISDKTEGFLGRGFVFDGIEDFLYNQSKGYFIIEADPGVGKSTIVAEYVRRTGCLAYFNLLSEGRTRAEDFLKSVCTQLIERYNLPYELPLHPDNTSNGNFLSKLLNEISINLPPGERLIIAVDALDEVDLSSQSGAANVLYLPANLPNGVYFILTKRSDPLPLVVSAPQKIFDLMIYPNESLEDVKLFIRLRTKRPAVQEWIEARGLTVEEFVKSIASKSENNFMYLKYVLDDIEQGNYRDISLESLPQGLEKYYDQHWHRMRMNVKPLPVTKLKIIYFLTKTRKPVSCGMLAKFSGEISLIVQEILDEWAQFLRIYQTEGKPVYSIYHAAFQDFLYRKDIVQEVESLIEIEGMEKQIKNNLLGMVYKNS
ncbi:MAG: hypothetical protein QNJ68_05520 [Microcoleaceae cyanobacterium MO_207.B10]|nr:hypothetical protein [Microcoleaceae cyanobacterium MO_207.B10]